MVVVVVDGGGKVVVVVVLGEGIKIRRKKRKIQQML